MTQTTRNSLSGRRQQGFIALIWITLLAAMPVGALAQPGDLYVTNLATNAIDVYSPDGMKSIFATGLNRPQGIAFDQAHNLYVADGGTGTIFKYDPAGNRTTFYAGLSAPVGLTVHGNRLLVVESGRDHVLTLALDGSAAPKTTFLGRDSMVGVEVAGDTYFVTWDTQLNSAGPDFAGVNFFYAAPRGLTAVPRTIGADDFDVYVATAKGDIWVVKHANQFSRSQKKFASGLSDPWGLAFAPRRLGGGEGGELYVADRVTGEIFRYTSDRVKSVFVSAAGIPNFLAFETE